MGLRSAFILIASLPSVTVTVLCTQSMSLAHPPKSMSNSNYVTTCTNPSILYAQSHQQPLVSGLGEDDARSTNVGMLLGTCTPVRFLSRSQQRMHANKPDLDARHVLRREEVQPVFAAAP